LGKSRVGMGIVRRSDTLQAGGINAVDIDPCQFKEKEMEATSDWEVEIASETDSELQTRVEALARQRLSSQCPYAFYFRDITCSYDEGVLILQGQLPTFYLKQVLQTLLNNVEGVERIENHVDVISANGLSSVRFK
jgi:hypothetical protein